MSTTQKSNFEHFMNNLWNGFEESGEYEVSLYVM